MKQGTLATSTQIVWTYIFELAFLHEGINGWSLSGTLLILGFMLLVGCLKMKNADPKHHEEVAGETEETALLFASERFETPPAGLYFAGDDDDDDDDES
jgi:hypothetical protein